MRTTASPFINTIALEWVHSKQG